MQDVLLGATICGTITADQGAGLRDVDRYLITAPANGRINVTYNAAFPSLVMLFHDPGSGCSGPVGLAGLGTLCACPLELGACVETGESYYVRITALFNVDTDLEVDPFLAITCDLDQPNQYDVTLTFVEDDPACISFPCPADSDIILTCNSSQEIVSGSVACVTDSLGVATYSASQSVAPDSFCPGRAKPTFGAGSVACGAVPQTAGFNRFGRLYDLSSGPAAGLPFFVQCVEIGIEANIGDQTTIGVNVYTDVDGSPPLVADLELLGTKQVMLAAGLNHQKLNVAFFPPLYVPADSAIFVEMAWESDKSAIFPGSNCDMQNCPVYIRSDVGAGGACGHAEYVDLADNFPNQATIINVHGTVTPCLSDLSGPGGRPDGVMNGFDLAALLGGWGLCGPSRCPEDLGSPPPGGVGSPGPPDGIIGGVDLAILLCNWGPCPGPCPIAQPN